MHISSFTAPPRAGWLARLGAVLLMLLVGIGGARPGFGQTITQAEYFLDTDPGYGLATALPIGTPAADLSLTATVDLTGLPAGFHRLGVRSKDAANAWSLTSRRSFYYEPNALAAAPNITKAEYFIDANAAVDVPLTAATDISGLTFTVDLNGTTAGFHRLSVRTQDANGKWSLVSSRSFYYEPNATAAAGNITRVEYFVDADPGLGSAVSVPVTAAADISGLAFTVDLGGLGSGFHRLSVRSKDANEKWSLVNSRTFYYEPNAVAAAPNITKVEYFIDANSAVDVPVTAATTISGLAFSVDLSSVAAGFHTLQVRSQDANGTWSLVSVRSFYYEAVVAAAPNINKIEYYFDTDPGFGSATDVAVTPAPTISGFTFVADASALSDGAHSLFLRSRDANGKWSLVWKRDFVKNGCASSPSFAAELPTANYAQGGSYGGSAQLAFTTNPATPNTGNTFYGYNGSLLQADLGGSQTLSEVRLRLQASNTSNFTVLLQGAASTAGPFTTIDTYTTSIGTSPVAVTRTLATPTAVRVLRIAIQNVSGQYLLVAGVGAYYFNCAGPAIVSFTPTGGAGGTSVDITGTNLSGATSLTFNGVTAQSFVVNSATSITAVAPALGSTGQICVTTPSGSACSSTNYVYPPTIATGTVSPASFCSSTFISVPFTTNTTAYNAGNQFRFQLSDASGNFTANSRLYGASVSLTANGGTISDTLAFRTPAGSGYRVRVVSSNPGIIGTDNGVNLTVRGTPAAMAAANSPVAYNGTIQLTAGPMGQSSYQWYVRYYAGGTAYVGAGQTLNVSNVQPSQSGKYFVYVTNSGGCQDSASVGITVQPNAVPVLAMSQFGYSGCAGAVFNIGFSVTGNSFLAGNAITAQLSDASGSFASATTTGTVNFTGQGSGAVSATIPATTPTGSGYRIRLVGSNPNIISQTDNGQNLSITTQPTATASSNSPVAYNGTIQLTAQAVAGATYFWSGPNFASNQQNPIISNAAQANAGTYSLYVTVGGCQSLASTTTVTVNPSAQPILTMQQFSYSGCADRTISFNFTVAGNTFGSGNVITGQLSDASGSFASPTDIGTTNFTGQGNGAIYITIPATTPTGSAYRIRLMGSNPSVISQNDNGSNLSLIQQPVAVASSNSPVASGGTIQLTAQAVAGATYFWTGPNFSSNQQNPTISNVSAANAGTYSLYVTVSGCQSLAGTTQVVVDNPTVASITTNAISGSYCPGAGINVGFTASGLSGSNVFTAQLSDANGSFASPVVLGTLSGVSSGTIAGVIPGGTASGSGYRVRVVGSSPATIGSDNGANLTISAAGSFTWLGGSNTNWFNPANWSCGVVPTSTSNVTIGAGATYYPIIVGGGAVVNNITVATGANFTVSSSFTIYGNVTNFGLWNPGGAYVFAGSGTQTIGGSSAVYFGSVTVNNFTTLSLSNNIYVSGNWLNNGTFLGGSYTTYWNGTGQQTIGGTGSSTFYHFMNQNAVGLTLNQFIYVGGNWTSNGPFFANGYGTVFNGTVAQFINGSVVTNFYNLTINNTVGVTLNVGIGIGGTFVNNGGFSVGTYDVVLNGTAVQLIGGSQQTTFYNLTINNTVGVTLSSNIYVLGNWINNGLLTPGLYTVYFSGTGAQLIGGTAVTTFYGLVLNNAVSVTLQQNIYVLGGFSNTGVFYGYYTVGGVSTGYFVRFGGSVAQVINVNATTYFWHFYADNAAGVSLASNIYVAGNFYLYSGSFAPNAYTVYFNGTGGLVQTVGGYTSLNFFGWNIGGGSFVRLQQNVTLTGSFVNAGTFYGYDLVGSVYTGYTFVFGGAAAQLIGGSGRYDFWHVTWNNAVSVTLNTNIHVLGNWLNNGGFFANAYTVFFDGTVAQLIGGTVNTTFHHVSILNLVSVTLNQPIVVLGNWGGTGVFLAGTYLVHFNGTGAQTLLTGSGTRFYHLRFNNATAVTLLSDIYLTGNWLNDAGFVAGGYAVYFSGTTLQTIGGLALSRFHHLFIGSGANVRLDRAITVLGNWTSDGAFLANSFVVNFGGNVAQLIGGTVSTIFHGIVIDNTVGVTLAQNIRVRGGWVNNGLFVPATYTVFFDGAVAQLIGGTASTTFYHLSILNTVGVTLGNPVFIGGNLTNDGLFTVAGYLVTFNGSALQTIGGSIVTIFNGVTFNNAVGVALGQHIRVRGDFRNLALFTAGGYIVYFDGSVAQGIYCPTGTLTFHDVTFANPAGVTLFNGIFLTGHWLNNGGFINGGQLVTFSGTTLQTIGGSVATVFHHFTLASGANVRLDRAITLVGNWLNNGGTFLANSFTVFFNGTALQSIGGTALTQFYHLTLNNLVGVNLDYDIDLTGNFVNNGGFCGCGHRTRFNGLAPQTITCSSGNTRFHDLTFANTTGVTLLDNIGVTGHWINDGGFIANNYLVLFSGTALQTIGGTVLSAFHGMQITNAVNVQLLRDITVAGSWTNSGIFSGNDFGVTFLGSVAQVLTNTGTASFHHVTITNPVSLTLAGNIIVLGNWLCNGVFDPASYTCLFNGTAGQTIGGTSQVRFYGLTINNLVGVTLNQPLYLLGNFVNNGLLNCGTYGWYCTGAAAQTLGGSSATRFYDLFIQNSFGVSCLSNLGVTHLLTLTTGNLASDGHLTLYSNGQGTAMVVNPIGGGIVTGRSTMERFITGVAAPGYRHYSSPMQLGTATVQEFADDLPVFELNPAYNTQGNSVSPFPTLFRYDESRLNATAGDFDQGWMVPTASDNLLPGQGYSAQTDATTTVDISGTLNNGTVSYGLSRGGQDGSGWNLVGNPYPAPMDWDKVPATTGLDKALYVFVPSGQYTGTYRSYVNGIGQNGGTKDLAAMQGFFVRATSPTATLSLTNAVRHTTYLSPDFSRPATTSTKPLVRLNVRNAAGRADETVVYFEPNAGLNFSADHDAYKVQFNGDGIPTLWSMAGNDGLSINGLPDLATAPSIPLGVRVSQDGRHTLNAAALLNLPAGTQVWLEDRVLGRRQDLAQDSTYAFQMQASYTGQRFFLWFQRTITATTANVLDARTSLYPNPATQSATLEVAGLREQSAVRVELLNTLGQSIRTLAVRPHAGLIRQQLDLSELPVGVYIVRLHAAEGTVVKRLVKE